jgi:nitrite reductase/ring-hydroxylating ferredoxin subunit
MAAAERLRLLCPSSTLQNGGTGVRFEVGQAQERRPAFAIRHEGVAFAYLNRCAHVGVELDWQSGQFFDAEGTLLICATHGALYDPRSGKCVDGPCKGQSLTPVQLSEADGFIHYSD